MQLRYGLNPHRGPATADPIVPGTAPLRVVSGHPSYVNVLDALAAWQLVRDAATAIGSPAAASFKHVSPAGAAVAGPIDAVAAETLGADPGVLSPVAAAYVRARDTDPRSSYGDMVAVSEPVDGALVAVLRGLVCDEIVAPGYEPGTVGPLAAKKRGAFCVLEADPAFEPPAAEIRDVWGLRLTQAADRLDPGAALPAQPALAGPARADALLALICCRHTQSNSVAYVRGGATLGVGAGQQSRVDCTRLAGGKVATWWLRRHERVRGLAFAPGTRRQDRIGWRVRVAEGDLTPDEERRLAAVTATPVAAGISADERRSWLARLDGVTYASDGAIRFRDNVDHAVRYGVRTVVEPGGSAADDEVERACAEHGVTLVRTGVRLFQH